MAEAQQESENKKHISDRLHGALHRGGKKATEDKAPAADEAAAPADEAAAATAAPGTATATEAELEAVAEVVLVVVAELVAEMVELIADLEVRVAALELAEPVRAAGMVALAAFSVVFGVAVNGTRAPGVAGGTAVAAQGSYCQAALAVARYQGHERARAPRRVDRPRARPLAGSSRIRAEPAAHAEHRAERARVHRGSTQRSRTTTRTTAASATLRRSHRR